MSSMQFQVLLELFQTQQHIVPQISQRGFLPLDLSEGKKQEELYWCMKLFNF